jgi:epoxide hydrolase-like predicted phosphatase
LIFVGFFASRKPKTSANNATSFHPCQGMPKPIKAVIFDLGGVVLGSPLEGIAEFERAHDLPLGFVNVNVVTRGKQGAFQRLERGELPMEEFYAAWQRELEDPAQVETFVRATSYSGPRIGRLQVDTRLLLKAMLVKSAVPDRDFIHCIVMLRGSGVRTAALTNNFAPMESERQGSLAMDVLEGLFDVVVESAVEGVRKPEPRAYELTCQRLGVLPDECAFLDDIGLNCKAAGQLGIHAIRVELANKRAALDKLEAVLLARAGLGTKLYPRPGLKCQTLSWNCGEDGGRLVADAFGHAADPCVILLHGGGQTRHAWGNTAQDVAKAGFFALAVDMKGHGESYWGAWVLG